MSQGVFSCCFFIAWKIQLNLNSLGNKQEKFEEREEEEEVEAEVGLTSCRSGVPNTLLWSSPHPAGHTLTHTCTHSHHRDCRSVGVWPEPDGRHYPRFMALLFFLSCYLTNLKYFTPKKEPRIQNGVFWDESIGKRCYSFMAVWTRWTILNQWSIS